MRGFIVGEIVEGDGMGTREIYCKGESAGEKRVGTRRPSPRLNQLWEGTRGGRQRRPKFSRPRRRSDID